MSIGQKCVEIQNSIRTILDDLRGCDDALYTSESEIERIREERSKQNENMYEW